MWPIDADSPEENPRGYSHQDALELPAEIDLHALVGFFANEIECRCRLGIRSCRRASQTLIEIFLIVPRVVKGSRESEEVGEVVGGGQFHTFLICERIRVISPVDVLIDRAQSDLAKLNQS